MYQVLNLYSCVMFSIKDEVSASLGQRQCYTRGCRMEGWCHTGECRIRGQRTGGTRSSSPRSPYQLEGGGSAGGDQGLSEARAAESAATKEVIHWKSKVTPHVPYTSCYALYSRVVASPPDSTPTTRPRHATHATI